MHLTGPRQLKYKINSFTTSQIQYLHGHSKRINVSIEYDKYALVIGLRDHKLSFMIAIWLF